MKQTKKINWGWMFLSVLPVASLLVAGLGFSEPAIAGPDLQVRVWVDARSVHKNSNNTYNFTIRGYVKNVGNVNYVSQQNQQVLFLHEVGKAKHITNWPFSRLNRGQMMKVHVPVINQPGGEFVPAYELALSFDPDIYTDSNPANDDRNSRNNKATVSSRTLSNAFARSAGAVSVRPVGIRPGVIKPAVPVQHGFPRGKKPDLIPVVVNAYQGSVQVRNIGNAPAGASKLFVICSIISGGRSTPCASGLHLPNYDVAQNTLMYRIPALRPGARYGLRLFGPRALPSRPGTYGMKLFADGERRVAESNERNNDTRLDTVIKDKPVSHPQPQGKKPDLTPVLRGSNPFKGIIKIKNRGAATAGASKLVLSCKKMNYRGPGGGCANSPVLNRYYNASLGGLVLSVPSLRAGQVYTARLPLKGLKWNKGKYKFTINTDATRVVAESNERNNLKRMIRRRR